MTLILCHSVNIETINGIFQRTQTEILLGEKGFQTDFHFGIVPLENTINNSFSLFLVHL